MRGVMVILLALMLTGQAWAAIDTWQFKDEAQEQAFREITSQLRCPKCQNNSIADSNAMIAADMRQKVYELMQQGKTKGQIVDYMVARYGHFVSYEPPLTAGTVLLWLGPGLFVLAGAGVIIARARVATFLTRAQRRRAPAAGGIIERRKKNDEPVGGYRRAAAGWRAGAAVLPVVGKGAVDRDALNRALYQSRLQELAQERGEDNPALVVELQRTLLTDIPPQPLPGERR